MLIVYIQIIITILSSGLLAWFLKKQISIQKIEIESLKSTLDTFERYSKLINIEDFEKYVTITKKVTQMEERGTIDQSITNALDSTKIQRLIEECFFDLYGEKYLELVCSISAATIQLPEEKRDIYLKENYPNNYDSLKRHVKNMIEKGFGQ